MNIIKNWEALNKHGVNAVTCGHCGEILYHQQGVTMLKCYHCGELDDISSFGDLYYNQNDFNFIFGVKESQ